MEEKSAFVMIKFEHKDRFVPAYKEIYSMDDVISCEATKGIYDIVLFLKSVNIEKLLDEIKHVDGIKELDFMPLAPHVFGDGKSILQEKKTEKNDLLSSYVMVEAEKEKIENLYKLLCSTDNVASCDLVKGKFDIILLIQSESFDEIDKSIKGKMRMFDGILRIKECPVIKMC